MAYARPSPAQLSAWFDAEVAAALPGSDPRLRRSPEGILARIYALGADGLHGHLAWAADQMFPDRAEAELLDRHGAIWGVPRRTAVAATGPVTLVGAIGSTIPAGTRLGASVGLAASSTPMKPPKQAIHLTAPTFSSSTKMESTMILVARSMPYCPANSGNTPSSANTSPTKT